MKLKKHISSLLIAMLLVVGVADALAQAPGKMQTSAAASATKPLEFTAFVSDQMLHVDFEGVLNADFTIELYNLTGAKVGEWKVQKNGENEFEVNLNEPLRKGLYIIKVSAGQHVMAKKVQV